MTGYPEGLDPEELAFQRLYGPWKTSTPEDARRVLDGYDGQWWIAGGWAIEAFTGVRREHEDIDLSLCGVTLRSSGCSSRARTTCGRMRADASSR